MSDAANHTSGASAALEEWESYRSMGYRMVDEVINYYKNLASGDFPVKSTVSPGYLRELIPSCAPETAEKFEDVLADVHTKIMPGVSHWQSPMFFGYFPANTSPPAMLADMLSDAINCIGFSWVASPACTELETIVLDWMAKLCDLPDCFLSSGTGGGVIQGTASEATLVALLAARERAITSCLEASETTRCDIQKLLVCYCSEHAHSSVEKAAMIAGLDAKTQFRKIGGPGPSFSMDVEALETAMQADKAKGLVPFFVCATLGTTSSGGFDDITRIGKLCRGNNVWLHTDAAWAGSAFICPEFRHHLNGIEFSDSYDFNPHKWLRVNFDCSTMFVQDRKWLIKALSITPEYLRSKEYDAGFVSDYRDWQVPLGRRFRSLKLWFVLRMYGAAALRDYIRRHCLLAHYFADNLLKDERFELFCPVSLSLVCFRLRGTNDQNERLLNKVTQSGLTYMVNTKLDNQYVLRLAVGSPLTDEGHIDSVIALLRQTATTVLAEDSAAAPTTASHS